MPTNDRTRIIYRRTPESAAMVASVKRAMALTAKLNRLTYDDADKIRDLFSELIGKKVDESFLLIPPFYTTGGDEIRVGRNVFVNQNWGDPGITDDSWFGILLLSWPSSSGVLSVFTAARSDAYAAEGSELMLREAPFELLR